MHIVICDDESGMRKQMQEYLIGYFKEKDIQ